VPREIKEDRLEAPQQIPRFAFEERRRGDRRGWPTETELRESKGAEGGDGDRTDADSHVRRSDS
jgi:hypothetical protein